MNFALSGTKCRSLLEVLEFAYKFGSFSEQVKT